LFTPDILKSKFGVDVAESKNLRIVEDKEVWEYEPGLKRKYQNLCCYVQKVVANDGRLGDVLRQFG
jgi:hypothetical protein